MNELYKTYPRRYRLIVLIACIAIAAAMPFEGVGIALFIGALVLACAIAFSSMFAPHAYLALQQDNRNREGVNQANQLIDALYDVGFFDDGTNPDLVEIEAIDNNVFYLCSRQVGKTEKQIKEAVQNSMLAFNAVSSNVEKLSGSEYLITFSTVSDLDKLAATDITYSKLLGLVMANEY